MTTKLSEIEQQIALLEKQKKAIIAQEKASVAEQVRGLITQYGLTAAECGFGNLQPKVEVPAKYRNPNPPHQTWAGRGGQPKWYRECLARGITVEQLTI